MHSILAWARNQLPAYIALLREMVECESPSDDPAAVDRFVDLLSGHVSRFAKLKSVPAPGFGKHLLCEFPTEQATGQVLVLAHSDTVWPMGTLRTMPFREEEGRLWGPGTLDMKGGIAIFLFAMQALRELGMALPNNVLLQVNSDEEVGSMSSRPLTEDNARASKAVLVLEPGTGLTGKLKTARKGVGVYSVKVRGRAAHAGVDFLSGVSAIRELARQIEVIAGFTNVGERNHRQPRRHQRRTRTNVVAAEARVDVDVRIQRTNDAAALDRRFHGLRPFDQRCAIQVTGGLNRPPMERSPGAGKLFRKAQDAAREIDLDLEESATGGGSDGNFTAALGVPTLDGLGAVGEGAHADNESLLIDYIPARIAVLAGLLSNPL